MAEWLRSGLQIRARRFDSGSGLQSFRRNPRYFIPKLGWNANWRCETAPCQALLKHQRKVPLRRVSVPTGMSLGDGRA